jgi:hypothetical protein
MSGAHCPNLPACMKVSDQPRLPVCEKAECPGRLSPVSELFVRPWLCAGCGKPSVNRERTCECPTGCLYRLDPFETITNSTDYDSEGRAIHEPDETVEALKLAISHIEHMAAFIADKKLGYSFESLGEDMPSLRAALTQENASDRKD